ncbi:MAG: CoA transferase [Chloroflexi bacterium]|nr:CoA transferase [Chloroflexota bacterium]
MTDGLLSGLRALDLTDEKGALCGKILADLGVDTIKIEKPGGDSARDIPPFYHGEVDPRKSLNWFSYNTNKRGITLNLETGDGQALFRQLVKKADFIIESFQPGYMDKLGLGYERLAEVNPRVIMTSITPFGQNGPYSSFKASDLVVQALAAPLFGDPDRAPVRVSVPQAYLHAGADAAEGTMVAHYFRSLTGEGQHVDVSAMESVICVEATTRLSVWNASRTDKKRMGSLSDNHGLLTPTVWACKDGYVTFSIAGSLVGARRNQGLTEWMDSEDMAPQLMKEIDWNGWDWLQTTQTELESIIKAISLFFMAHTVEELREEGIRRGVMLHKVCNAADTVNNPQLRARGFWINVEHDELGDTISYPGAFAKFSLTPVADCRRPPLIGEHNCEIYGKELGLSEHELGALKTNGTI